eukprot:m.239289 g.239289  ORF g.239289 m.239289 type:complete len:1575 (+) comp13460_c0_seq1:142-4866(+)
MAEHAVCPLVGAEEAVYVPPTQNEETLPQPKAVRLKKTQSAASSTTKAASKPRISAKRSNSTSGKGSSPEPTPDDAAKALAQVVNRIDEAFQVEDDGTVRRMDGSHSGSLDTDFISRLFRDIESLKRVTAAHALATLETAKLHRLLSLMDSFIEAGLPIVISGEEEEGDDEAIVLRAFAAVKVVLSIMTSPNMPKEVFVEEVIEHTCDLLRKQLESSVLPAYDLGMEKMEAEVTGTKRRASTGVKRKENDVPPAIARVYSALCHALEFVPQLLSLQPLNDTLVLQLSTIGLAPMTIDGPAIQLQLNGLNIVRSLFSYYPTHRQVIIEDFMASLARIPAGRRKEKNFTLAGIKVQLISGMIIQMVQFSVATKNNGIDEEVRKGIESMEAIAKSFLTQLLDRASKKKDDTEVDYKAILDNLINDTIETLFEPSLPASEILLGQAIYLMTALCRDKPTDPAVRVLALDHLGAVAAAVFRNAAEVRSTYERVLLAAEDSPKCICGTTCEKQHSGLNCATCGVRFHERCVGVSEGDDEWVCGRCQLAKSLRVRNGTIEGHEKLRVLHDIILRAFFMDPEDDPVEVHAGKFYSAIWICQAMAEPGTTDSQTNAAVGPAVHGDAFSAHLLEVTKKASFVPDLTKEQLKIAYRYWLCLRPLGRSLDNIVRHIVTALSTTESRARAQALKSLTTLIEVNPDILGNDSVKVAVNRRLMDEKPSVRKEAVDLLGTSVLATPAICDTYYEELMKRIMDVAGNVRKKVITIMRDLCIQQPDFPKVPAIYAKLLGRMDDTEDGVKELITKSFHSIWFSQPSRDSDRDEVLLRRVVNICHLMESAEANDQLQHNLEQLLSTLLNKADDKARADMTELYHSMVQILMKFIIDLQGSSAKVPVRLQGCLAALDAFCKTSPKLLVSHALILLPYLHMPKWKGDTKEETQDVHKIVFYSARILSVTIPEMTKPGVRAPSNSDLKTLEEDLTSLIFNAPFFDVIEMSVACLASSVTYLTFNYELARQTVEKFYNYLRSEADGKHLGNDQQRHKIVERALYSCGLLCQHIAFESEKEREVNAREIERRLNETSILDVVFLLLLHYADKHKEEDVRVKALTGLGFIFLTHPLLMARKQVITLFEGILKGGSIKLKLQVVKNIKRYLSEEDAKLAKAEAEQAQEPSPAFNEQLTIAKIGGQDHGVSSVLIGRLAPEIHKITLSPNKELRQNCLRVVQIILNQGLVNPMHWIEVLVALTADPEDGIREQAEAQLLKLNEKKHDFIRQQAVPCIAATCDFVASIYHEVSGMRKTAEGAEQAFLHTLYTALRAKKPERRPFLSKCVDRALNNPNTTQQRFAAETLAYLPYEQADEVLYVLHVIREEGSRVVDSIAAQFRTVLGVDRMNVDEDEEDGSLPEEVQDLFADSGNAELLALCDRAHAFNLVHELKCYLQQVYGYSDSRLETYKLTDPAKLVDGKVFKRESKPLAFTRIGALAPSAKLDKAARVNRYRLFKQVEAFGDFLAPSVPRRTTATAAAAATPMDADATPTASKRAYSKQRGRGAKRGRGGKGRGRKSKGWEDESEEEDGASGDILLDDD